MLGWRVRLTISWVVVWLGRRMVRWLDGWWLDCLMFWHYMTVWSPYICIYKYICMYIYYFWVVGWLHGYIDECLDGKKAVWMQTKMIKAVIVMNRGMILLLIKTKAFYGHIINNTYMGIWEKKDHNFVTIFEILSKQAFISLWFSISSRALP